jgi:phosphate transport system substrate-binding protein
MKKPISLLSAALLGLAASAQATVQLSGAGASFPAPLYQRWAVEFNKANPDIQINYQSVGSGAGIKQFTAGTVDFAASDAAMTDEQIAKVAKGAVMIPATAGSIVIAYNLPGVTDLKLSRDAYAGIFLGKIKNWNDEAIKKTNPGVNLPDMPINVAYRSDGSGTTFVFTKHLSAINKEFADQVGSDTTVTWPVGAGGKGNEGVTALIKQTPGTVGYVEYGYAANNGLSFATLENKSGKFVKADDKTGPAALVGEMPANLRVWFSDPESADAYPIATFTWLLLYKKYDDATKLDALKKFVKWGLTEGQKFAPELGYIPLPAAVVEKDMAALDSVSAK